MDKTRFKDKLELALRIDPSLRRKVPKKTLDTWRWGSSLPRMESLIHLEVSLDWLAYGEPRPAIYSFFQHKEWHKDCYQALLKLLNEEPETAMDGIAQQTARETAMCVYMMKPLLPGTLKRWARLQKHASPAEMQGIIAEIIEELRKLHLIQRNWHPNQVNTPSGPIQLSSSAAAGIAQLLQTLREKALPFPCLIHRIFFYNACPECKSG